MENFQLTGLVSGFDSASFVERIMQIERAPQRRLQGIQRENSQKISALDDLEGRLGSLGSVVDDLKSSELFSSKSVSLSDENVGISASASSSAAVGSHDFEVLQLAAASKRVGSEDVGGNIGDANTLISNLRLAEDVTEGTFSVNGQSVSVSQTDSLQDVLDAISVATSGVVTGSYDDLADKVTLTSSSGELDLGASDDTSNFLAAMKLDQLEVQDAGGGSASVSSSRALGVVDLESSIADSGIAGVTGAGTVTINGVAIDFDADSESMQTFINRVNASDANVTLTYDSTADQFRMVNNQTGALSMHVGDSGNGLLASLGLDGSAEVGKDLQFTVDGGATKTSRTNAIDSDDHGLAGLTVEASALGKQTVSVGRDSAELREKIDKFISAFNDVQTFIDNRTRIEVNGDQVETGLLASNREVTALSSDLRGLAFQAVEGASSLVSRLESLGIDFVSGTSTLQIKDTAALDEALENNLDEVETFFREGADSFAERMDDFIDNITAANGIFDTQKESLSGKNARIDSQIEAMERRLQAQREALEAGFRAMEEAQANFNQQSAALQSLIDTGG